MKTKEEILEEIVRIEKVMNDPSTTRDIYTSLIARNWALRWVLEMEDLKDE